MQVESFKYNLICDKESSSKYYLRFQSIEVTSPPGTVIGSIHQEWSILAPKFTVRNASDDVILRIEGPFCTYSICGDVEFQVSELLIQNLIQQDSSIIV